MLNIMSATLANPEDNVAQPAKLFGLPRPLAGALIGILIFLLIAVIFRLTNLFTIFIILISPGILTGWMMIPSEITWITSLTTKLINYSVLFGISSVPPGIFGSLIASNEKKIRSKGIILLLIYLIFLLVIGIPISTVFD